MKLSYQALAVSLVLFLSFEVLAASYSYDTMTAYKCFGEAQDIPCEKTSSVGYLDPEYYDMGGEGVSYDGATGPSDQYSTFRDDEKVDCHDIQWMLPHPVGDYNYNVCYTNTNEWLVLTVDIYSPGIYKLTALAANTSGSEKKITVSLISSYPVEWTNECYRVYNDYSTVDISIPVTTAWNDYQNFEGNGLMTLPRAGEQKMCIRFQDGAVDLDYVKFERVGDIPMWFELEEAHMMPVTVWGNEFFGAPDGTAGISYNPSVKIVKGPHGNNVVGETTEGQWIDYYVNVDESGDYRIVGTLCNADSAGSAEVSVEGVPLGEFEFEKASDWDAYTTVGFSAHLDKGDHHVRITFKTPNTRLEKLHMELPEPALLGLLALAALFLRRK